MNALIRKFWWKWLALLAVSGGLVAFSPMEFPQYRAPLFVWVVALCIALPIAHDYWGATFSTLFEHIAMRLVRRFGKERGMALMLIVLVIFLFAWLLLVVITSSGTAGQLLFLSALLAVIFWPTFFTVANIFRSVNHA